MSYIIKNCPNLTTSYYGTGETIHNQCGLTDDDLCTNCTGCVMKQIVELCEQYKKDFNTTNGVWLLANNITNLLDIEECE